jgi:hypothetical protein
MTAVIGIALSLTVSIRVGVVFSAACEQHSRGGPFSALLAESVCDRRIAAAVVHGNAERDSVGSLRLTVHKCWRVLSLWA